MGKRVQRWALASASLAMMGVAAPALALSLGMVDTFQSGTTEGWSAGAASSIPPALVTSGGPAGAGDAYLYMVATGGLGPNSRLTAIAGPQWAGSYIATGVEGITLDVKNFGSTDLDLRLWLSGPLGATALSSSAVRLPAGSGWTPISFSLDISALSGQPGATLADTQQLRLYHSTTAGFPGDAVVAALGVDNVTAVPEPGQALLLAAGLLALGGRRWRRAPRPD